MGKMELILDCDTTSTTPATYPGMYLTESKLINHGRINTDARSGDAFLLIYKFLFFFSFVFFLMAQNVQEDLNAETRKKNLILSVFCVHQCKY